MNKIKQITESAFSVPSYSTITMIGVAPYTGAFAADLRLDDDSDNLIPDSDQEDERSEEQES